MSVLFLASHVTGNASGPSAKELFLPQKYNVVNITVANTF